jgi:tellurite resistance protein
MSVPSSDHALENALPSRLAYMPISLFGMVMGIAGFTIAMHKGESLLSWSHLTSQIFTGITFVLFSAFMLAYLAKLLRHPNEVRSEFNHVVRLSFFPAISISLILLSILALNFNHTLALWLWGIGTPLQLLFTLIILSNWIHHEKFQIHHSNPAWFIPIVGNILVPITGAALGFIQVSWFFFSVGLIFWIVLLTILMNRYFFHAPTPSKLMPTLFILIAPPAVGFISWHALHPGGLDDMGHILYNFALFITLMLFFQAKRFVTIPFGLPFWAFTFPIAAITIATLIMYHLSGQILYAYLAGFLFGFLALLIAYLLVKTIQSVMVREICVPE